MIKENINHISDINRELMKQIFKEYKEGIVGYVRTAHIDDHIMNIKRQKDIILCFCKEYNIKCKKIYIEEGFSGINYERPNIKNITKSNKEKVILTTEFSRFSRDMIALDRYVDENDKIIIGITDGVIIRKNTQDWL